MITQYDRRITQTELRTATFIIWIAIPCFYTMNNIYQNTKNLNHKTYRIKKLKFPEIRTKITHKPRHRRVSQHRTKTVPKPYRNPKKRTIRYDSKNVKINEFTCYLIVCRKGF